MSFRRISLIASALFSASLVFAADSAPGHHAAWIRSEKTAFAKAKKEKKLVVVDAFADWCGWCKKLDRDVLDKDEFIAATKGDFVFLRLNTEDRSEGSAFAARHRIANLPTTVVFDADQIPIGKIVGYRKFEDFLRELKDVKASHQALLVAETAARKGGDATKLFELAQQWKYRGSAKKAQSLAAAAADAKSATSQVRANAAYEASAAALELGDLVEAEKRLAQLESIQPFPQELDNFPELIRSDLAAARRDWDVAIQILEAVIAKGTLPAQMGAGLGARIDQLRRNREADAGAAPKPVPPSAQPSR